MEKPLPQGGAPSTSALALGGELRGFYGRELASYEELRAANELYVRVFNYSEPEFALNLNLLCALVKNGGSVVGVFAPDDELVGFAYGFAGKDRAGNSYHYSQSAVVEHGYQGLGVGRSLKQLQREVAERLGNERMRWTFDPILARNAHFNLSTLGAVGFDFQRDYYSRPGTDRLLVDWTFDQAIDPYQEQRAVRTPVLGAKSWGEPETHQDAQWLPLPTDSRRTIELGLRSQISGALESLLSADLVLIDCRRTDSDTAAYLAVPRVRGSQGARLSDQKY